MSTEEVTVAARTSLSKFEIVLSCNPPILASFLLHAPTTTIFQLYHTSSYLRQFLRSYPTAWKYLSFRLLQPSPTPPPAAANVPGANGSVARQSRNYALDQLLLNVVNPYSSCLKSLELDNTAVSGQILISTVLSQRRETLKHLSIRGCKNVSLKYHIVPWLTLFSLQMGGQSGKAVISPGHQELALKSLYTYRCRHHRRRPYLPSSLTRKDSDSEPTHELVILCHQLGIWTDTAWCTTPGVRCFRRRGYVTMRAPADTKEVWVVYDRLWRSKNWVGLIEDRNEASRVKAPAQRDGRVWEQDENGTEGEALGVGNDKIRYGDGKHLPMHLRKSHCEFVEAVTCDNCSSVILERCEQCSVLMHCAGCRKTLCASCAFDRPYTRNRPGDAEIEEGPGEERKDKFWWAPGYSISPCSMQDQDDTTNGNGPVLQLPNPSSKFKWCCTEPVFSGGGGITFGPGNSGRDFERMRAAPLPKGEGWEDAEFHSGRRAEKEAYLAQEKIPSSRIRLNKTDHYDVMHQLLGPEKQPSLVPRNLCDECYASKHWKVKCKACSQSLCLQHDLRGLKMRLCGYRDLASEKEALNRRQKSIENMELSLERLKGYIPVCNWSSVPDVWHKDRYERLRGLARSSEIDDTDSTNAELGRGPRLPALQSSTTEQAVLHLPAATPSNHNENDRLNRPTSPSSNATAAASRSTSPAPSVDSVTIPTPTPEEAPEKQEDGIEPHPRWIGCLGFACPQFRGSGDHRQRCSASFKECAGCKVNVCKECADKMPKPCRCDGCVERSLVGTANPTTAAVTGVSATINGVIVTAHAAHTVTASTSTIGIETNRFWCPNCRWERVQGGRCKAGQQRIMTKGKGKGKDKGKEKGKRKSQGSSEETTRPAPAPTGIDDETAQNVAEFEDLVARGDEALHAELNAVSGPPDSVPMADPSSIPAPPPLPPPMQPRVQGPVTVSINNAQHPSITNAEERDLDRISAMVDDLQTRIERLRVVYASRRQQSEQSEQSDVGDVGSAERSAARSEIVDGNGDGGGLAVEAEEMD